MTSTVKTALNQTRFWLALTLGRAQPTNRQQHRYVRVLQASLAAVAGRGITIVIGLVSVPLTIGYLGAERYGVWMTISTLIAWLYIVDLGLGNGLTNALSEAYADERTDLAQRYVATTFWAIVGVATALAVALAVTWSTTNWPAFFNVKSSVAQREVKIAVGLAFAFFVLNLPLTIVTRVLTAYQEGAIGNAWTAAGNLASLLGIVLVTQLRGGLGLLIVGVSGTQLCVALASAVWLFGRHKPALQPRRSLFDRHVVRALLSTGLMFFVTQIASLLILQSGNIIIARLQGAGAVTPYSVTWRMFSYTTMVQTLTFGALWPAFNEAFARQDLGWIRRSFNANLRLNMGISALLIIPLVIWGRTVIEVWAGTQAIPPSAMLYWMAAWSLIYVSMSAVSCLLLGAGRVQGQMIYGTTTAIVNVVLSVWLVQIYGATGVIAATVLAYLLCNVFPAAVETALLLHDPLRYYRPTGRAREQPQA